LKLKPSSPPSVLGGDDKGYEFWSSSQRSKSSFLGFKDEDPIPAGSNQ
jgi:hypothetical protein